MIYIGLPVHDERHTIGPLLWRIRKVLVEQGGDFHLVVVDDASGDGTDQALEPYRRILPLTLIHHDTRRGYAASLERIVREALERSAYHRRDALLTLQADFTDAPEAIPEMIRHFRSGADLVLGVPRPDQRPPASVRLGRAGASLLSRSIPATRGVEDPLGGFRLYRLFMLERPLREASDADGRLLHHQGWAANAEMLARVLPRARRVEEVEFPLTYTRRYRESRFRALPELWGLLRVGMDRGLRRAARGEEEREAALEAGSGSG
ncbi:MAG: glycosyltransferase family 2 protein [Candidatus Palauibacterales bacterium]|nr:glycosyltransferase family 2 protein [Candidatus Palauibacterales bacterium]MDP2528510.1 glycosyltransferase family 2 protein [Candidatus Palauibacterales bacterium]MDP2584021.1 glycosyltransferase family 2 protein [Candidatus Palauibacterales bacterium]